MRRCKYVVRSSMRPRCPTLVVRCCRFLLSWLPLRDGFRKFRAPAHGALLSTFVAFIAIVVVVAMNASCAPSEDIVIDISYVVINAVINSWCAYARWLMDSSCACALSSRIVRLHTRVSLSTFLAVIAKMKSSCAYAQLHISRIVVCCRRWRQHTVRNEARVPAHGDLTSTYNVVTAFVMSPSPTLSNPNFVGWEIHIGSI